MLKKWLIVIALLIIVFGAVFGGKAYMNHRAAVAASHQSYPPTTVSTATAEEQSWNPKLSTVGSLEAVAGTQITAQIAGNVMQIAFKSGTRVKQGALLVRLDDSTQLAGLHADEAQLQLAKSKVARARRLFKAHATSQAELQNAEAAIATAKAAIESDRATLKKLRITAPFNGTVGIRKVSLGQYVSPGTPIVNLQSYDPIHVNFSLPQAQLSHLDTGHVVHFSVNAYPDQSFIGHVTAIGSRVDPDTRNINVQATLKNPDKRLRPGLFGTVTLEIGQAIQGIVVPDTAIAYSTFGDTVYVVRDQGKGGKTVHAVIVQVGQERDGKVLVDKGLKAGDVVVVAGQNKLRDGAPVVVDNTVRP